MFDNLTIKGRLQSVKFPKHGNETFNIIVINLIQIFHSIIPSVKFKCQHSMLHQCFTFSRIVNFESIQLSQPLLRGFCVIGWQGFNPCLHFRYFKSNLGTGLDPPIGPLFFNIFQITLYEIPQCNVTGIILDDMLSTACCGVLIFSVRCFSIFSVRCFSSHSIQPIHMQLSNQVACIDSPFREIIQQILLSHFSANEDSNTIQILLIRITQLSAFMNST